MLVGQQDLPRHAHGHGPAYEPTCCLRLCICRLSPGACLRAGLLYPVVQIAHIGVAVNLEEDLH